MAKKKRLNVLPNPWCALDKDARPVGACSVDPDLFGLQYIGAWYDRKQSKPLEDPPEGYTKIERENWYDAFQIKRPQRLVFRFDTEPLSLSATGKAGAIVRRALRRRELLPADETTAKTVGVKWCEPAEALAKEKAQARVKYDSMCGKGEFDRLAKLREPVIGADEVASPKPSEEGDLQPEADKKKKTAASAAPKKPGSK